MTDSPEACRILLVRHAEALARSTWSEPDGCRPLSPTGRIQAATLAARLGASDGTVSSVVSSPALRCVETVAPLASRASLTVVSEEHLREGSDPLDALDLILSYGGDLHAGEALVACSHGDVIGGILESLAPAGVAVAGRLRAPKASVWTLVLRDDRIVSAHYMAPLFAVVR